MLQEDFAVANSTWIALANILLAKATHVMKSSVHVEGDYKMWEY